MSGPKVVALRYCVVCGEAFDPGVKHEAVTCSTDHWIDYARDTAERADRGVQPAGPA